jgi:putative endonuclease
MVVRQREVLSRWAQRNDAGPPAVACILARMSAARQELGKVGESIAARWLRRQGWRIVAQRFRSGHRDLDLVVQRDGTVAFVEVKTRRRSGFSDPVESVSWRKRRELIRSAMVWADRFGPPGVCYRFDVVAVIVAANGARVRHVENAFALPETG